MPGCSSPLKRKGLLGDLKELVNALDDLPFNCGPGSCDPCCGPAACNPCCGPAGCNPYCGPTSCCNPCQPPYCQAPCIPCVQSPCPPCMPVCCPPPCPTNCCNTAPTYCNPSTIPCPVPCPPLSVPMCPPCAPCCRPCVPCSPPDAMICFKRPQFNECVNVLTTAKSREILNGVLYTGCLCEKRNGLQDDCPRSECRGSPECMTRPPSCGPSMFAGGKHIGKSLYGENKCLEEYQCFPLCGPCPVPCCPPPAFGCC